MVCVVSLWTFALLAFDRFDFYLIYLIDVCGWSQLVNVSAAGTYRMTHIKRRLPKLSLAYSCSMFIHNSPYAVHLSIIYVYCSVSTSRLPSSPHTSHRRIIGTVPCLSFALLLRPLHVRYYSLSPSPPPSVSQDATHADLFLSTTSCSLPLIAPWAPSRCDLRPLPPHACSYPFWGHLTFVSQQSQSGDRPQTQATATTCIEVAFDPCDLEEGGAGAGADSSHGGRGSGGRGRGRGGRRRGGGWEGGKHNFVRFVLYKENMDTQVALTILSRHLAIAAGGHNFGFAGTKDKRGVTCQFATAFKVSPSRLSTVNSHLRGIRVGNFSFCDEGLRLGCLSGNEFHLLMRDVRLASPEPPAVAAAAATTTAITADGEEAGPKGTSGTKIDSDVVAQVTAACETVARNGFINYFGLQRFGTGGAATQEVGKALLRGEYEKAARLVLTGRADERSDYADARRLFFDNGDAKGALRRLPHFMLGERAVLSVLATDPADWAGAMKAVPRTMRMMYLHAWQSYVWNSAASHRIRTYGRDGVVAGDLVLPRSSATAAGGEGLMLLGGVDDSGEGMEPEDESEGSAGTVTRRLALARLATEADVEAGRYNIFDVVLPLPGTEAQYPTHSTGAWIRKTAAEAGVDLDNPVTTSATNRELSFASLTGDYRYLLHRPKDFQFGFKRYTDPYDDSLILTDRDLLPKDPGSEKASQPQPQPQRQRQRQQQQEPEALGEGRGDEDGGASCSEATRTQPVLSAQLVNDPKPLLALELRFQLPPSCYATMLLRELMKTSTARTFHMGLSSAFAAPKSTEEAAEAEAQVVDAETTVAAIAEDAME
ncbi:hypothetical protein Vretifemale_10170 [Volvox reticuliferus]|uniref:TRUD domain-containing protein n=1 Tax=Volvox reticuliferus TaxID=1737510 RepID=A0A8J4CFZ8_9CHLO|nr:hypothetical protein Vretifemale_10170 [Volvox reticuliferus]